MPRAAQTTDEPKNPGNAMPQQVFQAKAASYCLLDSVSIFLDRENDRYHYLDREKTGLLDALRRGFGPDGVARGAAGAVDASVIKELTEKRLLTTQAKDGKALQPVSHTPPISSVYDDYWKPQLYPATIAHLAVQHLSVLRRIKTESLFETTQKAERAKASIAGREKAVAETELRAKAKKIIDSRYFVYTYRDKCLFDSYLFFTYFVNRRIPVNWVFGVNLYPFAAHCWVEYEGLVMNDPLERVAAFTPIYVI